MVKVKGCTLQEAKPYIDYLEQKYNRAVTEIELKFDGDYVEIVGGKFEHQKFERIRRITGYLVGDVNSNWVTSKQAEEKNRVKHGMEGLK